MRKTIWLAAATLLGGCLGVSGSSDFNGGPDGPNLPDPDGTDNPDPTSCPAYPEASGTMQGQVVPDIELAGNGPNGLTWSMQDFWCAAHNAENPATVIVMDIHSMTCSICMTYSAPALEQWQMEYGDRGLVPVGVSINEDAAAAQGYWEDQLHHTHPWVADPAFQTAQFFQGSSIGTPAFIVIDPATMQVVTTQQGWSGHEVDLFSSFLR